MSNLLLRPRVCWKIQRIFGATRAAVAGLFVQQWPRRHDDFATARRITWLNLGCNFAYLPHVLVAVCFGRLSKLSAHRLGGCNQALAEIYTDMLRERLALCHESSTS